MLFMVGCGGCHEDKPLQNIELSPETVSLEIKFHRFDIDLFAADFSNPAAACQQLYHKYGSFFCRFIEQDLLLAACNSDSVGPLLKPFVYNPDIVETHREIQRVFTDEKISKLNEVLSASLQRWHHFFPDSIVPEVIYYQSAWNSNIASTDSVLAISLDSYLGAQNKITKQLSPDAFPAYKKQNMEEKYILADAMKGMVSQEFQKYYSKKDLLNELIFYGKLVYIAEALAPEIPDSVMMSWSTDQLLWAEKHEWKTWQAIANEKVMFQSKSFDINKWFADGPFTGANGIPQDSPPQLGVWLGWKIVRHYMLAHPELTLQDLLNETDNSKILGAFKPNRS
jgi:hypothetical protein